MIVASAQPLWPEDPVAAAVVVSPSRVREGDRFAISIEIPPTDAALVTVVEPEYPASMRRVGGIQVISRGTGLAGPRATVVQVDMQAVQAGRRIISSFSITTPDGEYTTEPALVEISLRDDLSQVPYDLMWRVHRDRVFEGQSVVLTLDMVNVTEFTFPETIAIQPPAGALFDEAQGVGEIESTRYGETELFRLPVASYLLTPLAAGSVSIPAAEILALGFTRRAPALALEVLAVPVGAGETGAVGQFAFSSQMSATEIGLDQAVELRLRVSGTGNLPLLQFPEVPAEGLVVSDSETGQQTTTGQSGFAGWREQVIRYRPTSPGTFSIQVPSFSWFDPDSERVLTGSPRLYSVRVLDRSEVGPPIERALLPLLDAEQVRRGATLNLYRLPGTYLAMTPGAIMVVVVMYVRRRRRESIALFSVVLLLGAGLFLPGPDPDQLAEVIARYRDGAYAEAHQLAQQMVEADPAQPGLLYNSGVTAFAADEPALSVLQLRAALVERPFFAAAHEALDSIESELGLTRQFSRPRMVHPDVPLISAISLFYVIAVLLVIPKRRRKAGYAIMVIVVLFLFAGALTGFGFSLYQRAQPVAVVGPESAELKRIPEPEAQTWLTLERGTAVRLFTSRDGFLLVRTGYGIDGWIATGQLMLAE